MSKDRRVVVVGRERVLQIEVDASGHVQIVLDDGDELKIEDVGTGSTVTIVLRPGAGIVAGQQMHLPGFLGVPGRDSVAPIHSYIDIDRTLADRADRERIVRVEGEE